MFLDISIFLPPPTSPSSSAVRHRNTYIYTRSPPPILARGVVHLAVAHALHPPASVACLCAPRCVPVSAVVSYVCLSPYPFSTLSLHSGTCCPLGGSLVVRSYASVCLHLSLPMCFPVSWPLLVLGFFFFQVSFFERGREAREPPLPVSRYPWSSPTHYLVIPALFRLPPPLPLSLPPFPLDPIPWSKFVVHSDRGLHVRILQSSKRLISL